MLVVHPTLSTKMASAHMFKIAAAITFFLSSTLAGPIQPRCECLNMEIDGSILC